MCELKFTEKIDNLQGNEVVWLDEVYQELGLTLPSNMRWFHYWDKTGFHNIHEKPVCKMTDYIIALTRKPRPSYSEIIFQCPEEEKVS